jgi:hypothetical protein
MSKINETRTNCRADNVLREVWEAKDSLSAARGHSVDKLFADLRRMEKNSGHRVVNLQVPRKSIRRKAKAG